MEALWDMQAGGAAGFGAALLAGLAFRFSPVAFASIPLVVAYVTRARALKEAALFGGAFVAGMLLTHVAQARRLIEILGGLTLIAIGIYLLNESNFWFLD